MVLFGGKRCYSGSEADFSSSSSTGSLKSKGVPLFNSAGKKAPSRCRGAHIRPLPVFKPAGSPVANHDALLYAPYRTPPRASPSTHSSSCNSSPTSRRAIFGHYHSCGDNHGIRPPNPEQYLTPLQQKEVAIRHLKTKLLESENTVHDREVEIEELKAQLGRMREDWIEEECHRVEAQLSLKEARKEIKQLRQVVETMKSSLMEKDKGIQKYFIDINIQNRKLESLLHSMELAQSGSNLQEESALNFLCDSPDGGGGGKKMEEEEDDDDGLELEEHGVEAMADSRLLLNDEMANRADILEQVLMSTAVDFSQNSSNQLRADPGPGVSALSMEAKWPEEATEPPPPTLPNTRSSAAPLDTPPQPITEEKGIQADMAPSSPALSALLLQLLHMQGSAGGDTVLAVPKPPPPSPNPTPATATVPSPSPTPAPLSPDMSADSGTCCSELVESRRFMKELDFGVGEEEEEGGGGEGGCPSLSSPLPGAEGKRYWSDSFLVDLVAVAAPVLPTVAWLYSRHGVDGGVPVYNIGALIRGCCIMGLHSLRHVARGPSQ